MPSPFVFLNLKMLFVNAGLFAKPNAYLDPGSGSFILQLIIATLVGGAFILKTYWNRIKTFITRVVKGTNDQEE
jgi:hypothetical protein